MSKRALKGIRLSVMKDESTSTERQDQVIDTRINALGLICVGSAVDLNVSASRVNPFKRPQLGKWLNHRADEFDVLIFWRMDRAIRSMSDLHKLMDWAKDNKKEIIFCEGPGCEYKFDFGPGSDQALLEMAMMFATVIAWAARLETQAISERVASSHRYLREHGEWGGGVVPYGLMPLRKKDQTAQDHDDPVSIEVGRREVARRGWVLVHNPETLPILQEIIERVIDGENLLPICRDLNDRGVLSPRDYSDKARGRKRETPRRWNVNGMKLMLKSRILLGEWVHKGALNVNADGESIPKCDPITTQAEWDDLQAALTALSMKPKQRYSQPNPLLGVALCARCGQPFYLKQETQKGRTYSNLSCRTRHGDQFVSCKQSTISLRYAEELVTQMTLVLIGDYEVMRRRYVPGDDRSEELQRTRTRIRDLEDEYDAGLIDDHQRYMDRKRRLLAKLEEIGPDPVRAPAFQWIGTGQTYGQLWPDLESAARLKLLHDLGVKIYLGRGASPAADAAYAELYAAPGLHLSMVVDTTTSNRMIAHIQDVGARIRRNIAVWYLQAGEAPIHEIVARQ